MRSTLTRVLLAATVLVTSLNLTAITSDAVNFYRLISIIHQFSCRQ